MATDIYGNEYEIQEEKPRDYMKEYEDWKRQLEADKANYQRLKAGAGLIAPRTVENGLSLKNAAYDIGDWVAPTITYLAEVAGGDKEFDPATYALLQSTGLIPGLTKAGIFTLPLAEKAGRYALRDTAKEAAIARNYLNPSRGDLIKEFGEKEGGKIYGNFATKRTRRLQGGDGGGKLYSDPNKLYSNAASNQWRMSSRAQINADDTRVGDVAPAVTVMPLGHMNTGTNTISQGRQMKNTNTKSYEKDRNHGKTTGAFSYRGDDMYNPSRKLTNFPYGPFQTPNGMEEFASDPYTIHLLNSMNEQRNKYEYLLNKTRKSPNKPSMPKEEAMQIAIDQGRPDIADLIAADNKPRIPINKNKRFQSYNWFEQKGENTRDFLDRGNRTVEKELREQFAMIPDEKKELFAHEFGVYDLLEDWQKHPDKWADYVKKVEKDRRNRERANAYADRKYGRQ